MSSPFRRCPGYVGGGLWIQEYKNDIPRTIRESPICDLHEADDGRTKI